MSFYEEDGMNENTVKNIKKNKTEEDHPLQEVFDAVISQVTRGKGARHGGDITPFFDQPWYSISRQTGENGLIFQAMKKAGESCGKENQADFERELLGAIAYAAMAYLHVQIHGRR